MIELIPAIDILDGECVRLKQGSFKERLSYDGSPLELARRYSQMGFKRLHLVDLTAAKCGRVSAYNVLSEISCCTGLLVDYGGGIRDSSDVDMLLQSGARQVNIGTLAVKAPSRFREILSEFGRDRIILGADLRGGFLLSSAWLESSTIRLREWLERFGLTDSLKHLTVTDVSRDGTLNGPNLKLYRELRRDLPELALTASGGVRDAEDIRKLAELGLSGVIVGRALLEERINLELLSGVVC